MKKILYLPIIFLSATHLLQRAHGMQSPLHLAALCGKIGTVRALLADKRVDPNTKRNNGQSPLHTAAWHGNREIVEMFLAAGADLGDEEACCQRT